MKKTGFSLILFMLLSINSVQTQNLDEEKDFMYAYGLYMDDLYELAITAFDNYEKKYPESRRLGTAMFMKGDCQFFLNHFSDAVMSYSVLQVKFPNTPEAKEANLRLGQALFYNGEYEKAETAILNYIDSFDNRSAEGYYWLGEIYFAQNNLTESERSFIESQSINPTDENAPYVQNGLIYVALKQKDSLKVISRVNEFVDQWPEHQLIAEELLIKGQIQTGLAQYDQAENSLLLSAKKARNKELTSEALFFLSEAMLKQKKWQKAEKVLIKIIDEYAQTSKYHLAKYNYGWSLWQQGRYAESAEVFTELAIETENNSIKAMSALKLGQLNKKMGKLDLAEKNWQSVVKLDSDSLAASQAYYELGILNYEKKRYAAAINDFQNAGSKGPNRIKLAANKMMAESYLAMDNFTEAEKLFKTISSAEQDIWVESYYQQGWIQYKNRNWNKAKDIFRQIKALETQNPVKGMALFWLGEIEFNQSKNYRLAASYFIESAEIGHDKKIDAQYGYAWSLLKLKKYRDSEKIFKELENNINLSIELKGDVLLRLADISFAMKNYKNAIAGYMKADQMKESLTPPQIWHMYSQLAKSYRRNGNNADSRKIYEKAIREYPQRAEEIQLAKAEVLFEEGKYVEFIAELDPLIDRFIDPCRRSKGRYEIGDAYYNLREYDKAIANYRYVLGNNACKKYKKHAWGGVLYASAAMGNITKADEVYNSFSMQFGAKEIFDVKLQQGKYLLDNKYNKEAEKALNEALIAADNPDSKAEAFNLIAISYERIGMDRKAMEAKENAFISYSDPDDKMKLALTAIADARNKNKYDLVKKWLNQSSNIRPKDRSLKIEHDVYKLDLLNHSANSNGKQQLVRKLRSENITNEYIRALRDLNFGIIKLSEKDYGKAMAVFLEVMQKRTGIIAAEAQLNYAYSILGQENNNKAAEEFLRVRYLYGEYRHFAAQALFEVSEIYQQKGEKEKSKEFISIIINDYGDTEWAEKARKK